MKFALTVVFVATKCAVFAAVIKQWDQPMGKIVGGHEAEPHSHPYIVSLQIRFFWIRAHICGGSLLNNYWVLTAGHCVKESWLIRWLPMDVIAGAHDVDNFGPKAQVMTVERRIPHPSYDGGIGPNDLALLRVKTPFTYTEEIQPVKLPEGYKMGPESLTLTGWGVLRTTVFFPDLPSKLQEVAVTYIPYQGKDAPIPNICTDTECYEAVNNIKDDDEDNPLDEKSNICTGPTTGGVAACNGDSGGPLVQYTTQNIAEISNDDFEHTTKEMGEFYPTSTYEYNTVDSNTIDAGLADEDGIYPVKEATPKAKENNNSYKTPVILGIVSWGASPCGQEGAPTVYTKVAPFVDFIKQYIDT